MGKIFTDIEFVATDVASVMCCLTYIIYIFSANIKNFEVKSNTANS
jgi:hypothetical protein